jgi:thiamine biosynthesis lipoprotein
MLRTTFLLAAFLALGCAAPKVNPPDLARFEFEEPQMGVPFRIVLYAAGPREAERAADAAFQRVSELNAIMSDYETDSEVSKLSRSSEEDSLAAPLSEDLWTVINAGQRLAELSEGAFDMTVGPAVALWRKARREKELPDPARLENARSKVGYRHLVLDPKTKTARLRRFGMRLDLGAIAKGYAADEALEVLREHGIARALVAASGDLALGDAPPGAEGWRVEIVGYDRTNAPLSKILYLSNRGVATSGDLFQRLEIGSVRYSHILNPFTGVGMTNHALATVIASDCMTADMLATTCTILPPERSLPLAARYDAAVRVIRMEKETPVARENRRFRKLMND